MADVRSLHGNAEALERRRIRRQTLARELAETSTDRRSGFSARLNLLCSLAGERELTDGRIDDIAALQPSWEPGDVRGWLTDDRVPGPRDLNTIVRFMLRSLGGEFAAQDPSASQDGPTTSGQTSAEHWEAYLLLGSDFVESPLHALTHPSDKALGELASRTLLSLTREYQVPPHAYDAELAHAAITRALRDLNVSSAEEMLQPGHLRLLARRLFPDYC